MCPANTRLWGWTCGCQASFPLPVTSPPGAWGARHLLLGMSKDVSQPHSGEGLSSYYCLPLGTLLPLHRRRDDRAEDQASPEALAPGHWAAHHWLSPLALPPAIASTVPSIKALIQFLSCISPLPPATPGLIWNQGSLIKVTPFFLLMGDSFREEPSLLQLSPCVQLTPILATRRPRASWGFTASIPAPIPARLGFSPKSASL